MFLARPEIKELTDCGHKAGQISWLRARGWPFEIGAKGYPKVLRSVAVARLGGKVEDYGPQLRLTDATQKAQSESSRTATPQTRQVLLRQG